MIGIGDVVELHRATGQLHGRLDALALPPGHQVELHGRASSVNRTSSLGVESSAAIASRTGRSAGYSRCRAEKDQVAAKKAVTQMT
jgi:hypothetical protein